MANWQAMSFGGWDPLTSWAEGKMSSHFNRANARYQAKLNYKYAQRYAENSPSWTLRGYRAAGINPIVAAQHGQLSVSDNPTTVQPPDLGTGTVTGVSSEGWANAPWSPKQRALKEGLKQSEIKTESDQSALESQRSTDMLNVLQNTAKIGVLLKGLFTDERGTPMVMVDKEGDTSKPWLASPYRLMGKRGPVHVDEARPNEWLLRKAYQDDVELGSEKYWRATIPLITQSAKDIGAALGDILPAGKLGALFKFFGKQPANAKGSGGRRYHGGRRWH